MEELLGFLTALLSTCALVATYQVISAKVQRATAKSHRRSDNRRSDRQWMD